MEMWAGCQGHECTIGARTTCSVPGQTMYLAHWISGFSSVNSMKREHRSQSVYKKEKIGWGSFPER